MPHGSETWGPNASELQRLRRNDRSMVRWICGVSAHDDIPSDQLLEKLGLADITTAFHCGRLRWAGHVEHAPPPPQYWHWHGGEPRCPWQERSG